MILSIPDEGYSRNVSHTLTVISTFLLLYQSWLKCMEYVKGNHKECRPNSFICNKVFSFSCTNVPEQTKKRASRCLHQRQLFLPYLKCKQWNTLFSLSTDVPEIFYISVLIKTVYCQREKYRMPLSDGLILFFSCSSMPSHNLFFNKESIKLLYFILHFVLDVLYQTCL